LKFLFALLLGGVHEEVQVSEVLRIFGIEVEAFFGVH